MADELVPGVTRFTLNLLERRLETWVWYIDLLRNEDNETRVHGN